MAKVKLMSYYLDKQYKEPFYKDCYVSYENGPFDDKYFNTVEEAKSYIEANQYRLAPDEILEIFEEEE
ncbi:MAG: hypothetical protein J6S67_18680 [Methanobrevibacter sp.]|nr:hypothetical protein [Methanobrevibacter sp.]